MNAFGRKFSAAIAILSFQLEAPVMLVIEITCINLHCHTAEGCSGIFPVGGTAAISRLIRSRF